MFIFLIKLKKVFKKRGNYYEKKEKEITDWII